MIVLKENPDLSEDATGQESSGANKDAAVSSFLLYYSRPRDK